MTAVLWQRKQIHAQKTAIWETESPRGTPTPIATNSYKFHRQWSTWRNMAPVLKGIGRHMLAGVGIASCQDRLCKSSCMSVGETLSWRRKMLILEDVRFVLKASDSSLQTSRLPWCLYLTCFRLAWLHYPGLCLPLWLLARDKRWACLSAFIKVTKLGIIECQTYRRFSLWKGFLIYLSNCLLHLQSKETSTNQSCNSMLLS